MKVLVLDERLLIRIGVVAANAAVFLMILNLV